MKIPRQKSHELFEEAKRHLVGGVNSPVRSYRGFNFPPPFIDRAKGSMIWDADGNQYIDYVLSWGPMILGHAHPAIASAINEALQRGTSFGAPTEQETSLACLIKEAFPSIALVRFVSSGTEAAMSAIRAARGFTGKNKIVKFDGCYHGHADSMLVRAGSGLASQGNPDSAGVPGDFTKYTLVAKYNDVLSVEKLVADFPGDIAAIIVEPVAANMGCVPPEADFLKQLRGICDKNGIILIFDEVITGFRLSFGGAQEVYNIRADITCLGKILGSGLPMGAYGGRRDIMETVSPLGAVYQAGTLSGNPLCVAAGIATLSILKDRKVYVQINNFTRQLTQGISEVFKEKGVPHCINTVGSIFTVFFHNGRVRTFEDAKNSDRGMFNKYFEHMLNCGIYLAPSPFEASFLSLAHSEAQIERTIAAIKTFVF